MASEAKLVMNQYERETVQGTLVLFSILFLIFLFTRKRWSNSDSLPKVLLTLSFVWFTCSTLIVATEKYPFLEGLPFLFSYFFVIFTGPVMLAAGMLEGIVIVFHVVSPGPTPSKFSAAKHMFALLSVFACLCFYLIVRSVVARAA